MIRWRVCVTDEQGEKMDELVTLQRSKRLQQMDDVGQVQGIANDSQSLCRTVTDVEILMHLVH